MPFVRNSFTRMISKHRRSIRHQEVEEVDDEFDHILDLMMGEYRKNEEQRKRRRGSVFGHEVYNRSRGEHDLKLFNDYFAERPTYPGKYFRRRFRMSHPLFLRIAEAVKQHDHYFAQKKMLSVLLGFLVFKR